MVSILTLSVTCGDTSPKGRGLGKKMKFAWTANGSHFGGNNSDRRQWRIEEAIVGAAASKTRTQCFV